MRGPREKAEATKVVQETESVIVRYIVVTALINAGQAVAVALALWAMKMPGAWIWGLLCFVLEFIPYLGGTLMVALLSITAFAAFDGVGRALAAPASYLLITTIQNNVVSPYLYGNRLKLNPVAVLVAVIVWWFLWGTAGAFLAVPIIATAKVIADRVENLTPLAEFLGE
jgi:predicted PurR-regulated permease PerM